MAKSIEVRVPDIGGFNDVPVIEVLVKPGDPIKKNESIVTLESEKASMEVPAEDEGVVKDVSVKVGDKVSKGTVLLTLESDDQGTQPVVTPSVPSSFETPAARAPQDDAPQETRHAEPQPEGLLRSANGIIHASPAIRRFARELGVDLHGVSGTGPHGRVTREDVQGFVQTCAHARRRTDRRGTTFAGLPPWPNVDFAQYGPIERKPLPRIKKFAGPNLHRNWLQIPHITNYDEADITDLEAFRNEVNAEQSKSPSSGSDALQN